MWALLNHAEMNKRVMLDYVNIKFTSHVFAFMNTLNSFEKHDTCDHIVPALINNVEQEDKQVRNHHNGDMLLQCTCFVMYVL